MSPLDVLSAKLSAVRERQDDAFAGDGGMPCGVAAGSADAILAAMAIFASRSLSDLAVKARTLGSCPGLALAALSAGERALLASILSDAQQLDFLASNNRRPGARQN
jgi:hypothetical protein